jgi:hypothetical protein
MNKMLSSNDYHYIMRLAQEFIKYCQKHTANKAYPTTINEIIFINEFSYGVITDYFDGSDLSHVASVHLGMALPDRIDWPYVVPRSQFFEFINKLVADELK